MHLGQVFLQRTAVLVDLPGALAVGGIRRLLDAECGRGGLQLEFADLTVKEDEVLLHQQKAKRKA
jgi:hypothetical protein